MQDCHTYLCGHFAIVDPAQRGKVSGLSAVEAMVEARMVTIRERDHELPGFLCNLQESEELSGGWIQACGWPQPLKPLMTYWVQ